MESRATTTLPSTITKSSKRKLAERLLSFAFVLFFLLLACAFLFPEDVIPAMSFKNEQHKLKKQMEKEQRLVASAHHEDDERTFHDILNDHEKGNDVHGSKLRKKLSITQY